MVLFLYPISCETNIQVPVTRFLTDEDNISIISYGNFLTQLIRLQGFFFFFFFFFLKKRGLLLYRS
jgi:hypothetical protein